VKIDYNKDSLAMSMELLTRPVVDVQLYKHPLPPIKMPGKNVPLIQDIKQRGFIRVGYSPDSAPFSFFNNKGRLVGFDIDMAYSLANDLGVRLELVPCEFEDVIPSLRRNRFDIFMSRYLVTPDRAVRVNYSDYYLEGTAAFLVRDYKRHQFKKYSEIVKQHLKIGLLNISYYKETMKRLFPNAEIVEIHNVEDFLQGKYPDLDAVISSAESGSFMSLLYPEFSAVIPQGLENLKIPLAYPVRMSGASFMRFLNTWISLKKKDGTIDRFYSHWILGEDVQARKPRWCIARDVLHLI
jgi:ABC-type amino acid transport substrate-binding protein